MDIVIGRFQPFHKGHAHLLSHADQENLLILVGSAFRARNLKNPFSYEERERILKRHYPAATIEPLEDSFYNEGEWFRMVREIVEDNLAVGDKPRLVRFKKDESSYYLDHFPDWKTVDVTPYEPELCARTKGVLNATFIRELMYTGVDVEPFCGYDPVDTLGMPVLKQLQAEYDFIEEYKASWDAAPFPPTFNCSDAVVFQSGHVLLIRRAAQPGKGLWALPGGFIDQNETAFNAAIRELREETGLKVPEKVLRGSCFAEHVFDHPERSERGRTFSHAFGFHLDDSLSLPRIKGGDDADKAEWVSISEFEYLYEDHEDIIKYFLARL